MRLRTLPIIDIQTLPPRHYVPGNDGHLKQVPSSEVQDRLKGDNQPKNWLIAETVSRRHPNARLSGELKRLLAERGSPPRRVSDSQHLTPEGYERQETTWLHAPTVQGQRKPQNQPLPSGKEKSRTSKTDERRSYELEAEAAVANEASRESSPSRHSQGMRSHDAPISNYGYQTSLPRIDSTAQLGKVPHVQALLDHNELGKLDQYKYERPEPMESISRQGVHLHIEQQPPSALQAFSPPIQPRSSSPDKTRQHHHHFWHGEHLRDHKSTEPKHSAYEDNQQIVIAQADDPKKSSKARSDVIKGPKIVVNPNIVVTETSDQGLETRRDRLPTKNTKDGNASAKRAGGTHGRSE